MYDRIYNDIFEAETFLVFFFFIRRTGICQMNLTKYFFLNCLPGDEMTSILVFINSGSFSLDDPELSVGLLGPDLRSSTKCTCFFWSWGLVVQELLTSNFFKSFIISGEKTTSSRDFPSVSLELGKTDLINQWGYNYIVLITSWDQRQAFQMKRQICQCLLPKNLKSWKTLS